MVLYEHDRSRKIDSENWQNWQKSRKALFFSYLAVLALLTSNTMLSFIYVTMWLSFNIVWGGKGVSKIKYELLKFKDFFVERCSIQYSN